MNKALEKLFEQGLIMRTSDVPIPEKIKTTSILLDYILDGGIPTRRITQFYGSFGCVSGDTMIRYVGSDGHFRERTIKSLYELSIGKIKSRGRAANKNPKIIKLKSYSYNDFKLEDDFGGVVYSGKKEVFRVVLSDGRSIKATKNHKFYIGENKYLELKDLKIGDSILCCNNKKVDERLYTDKKAERITNNDIIIKLKWHPTLPKKMKKGSINPWYDASLYRLIYEANKNKMSLEDYINVLQFREEDKIIWKFPPNHQIHHKDKNHYNNNISNLELVSLEEHIKLHSDEFWTNDRHLGFLKIVNIENAGIEDVYDIVDVKKNNNYIANKIVVHNSGKSTLSACIANEALKQYKDKYILWLDVENRCSIEWIEQFIDEENRDRVLFSQPSVIEECGNIVREIVEKVDISLLIVDSIGGAGSARSFDKDLTIAQVGGNAMGVGMFCRAIVPIANKNNFAVIFLNQIRDTIGGYGPSLPGYPGGQALKHALEYNIYMRKTSNRVMAKDEFDNDYPIGNEIAFKIVKGQNLGKSIKTNFYTTKTDKNCLGFDRLDEIIRLSIALGIISKAASSYSYDKFPNGKLVGQNKVIEFLKNEENKEILLELEKKLYNKLESKVETESYENIEE